MLLSPFEIIMLTTFVGRDKEQPIPKPINLFGPSWGICSDLWIGVIVCQGETVFDRILGSNCIWYSDWTCGAVMDHSLEMVWCRNGCGLGYTRTSTTIDCTSNHGSGYYGSWCVCFGALEGSFSLSLSHHHSHVVHLCHSHQILLAHVLLARMH